MNDQLSQALIAEIQKFYPKSSIMVTALADILRIERGAVYRRLRQEVPFTFNEIAIIAKNLNISLDTIVGVEGVKTVPFQLQLPDFVFPQEEDCSLFNNYIKFLRSIDPLENSETASISNVLPHDLFGEFHSLFRFYLFVWNYHCRHDKPKPFHLISTSPEMSRFMNNYMMEMKNFTKTSFVFDNRMFRFFVDRVNYFHSIRLIEKEDVSTIKEELFAMLDYLEKMAITGQFQETGKAVNLYISDIDINTSYAYMEAKKIHLSMVKVFVLSYVTSLDENTFDQMKKWIHSVIKISTLITLTNERQRVLYFEKQRKMVNEL